MQPVELVVDDERDADLAGEAEVAKHAPLVLAEPRIVGAGETRASLAGMAATVAG